MLEMEATIAQPAIDLTPKPVQYPGPWCAPSTSVRTLQVTSLLQWPTKLSTRLGLKVIPVSILTHIILYPDSQALKWYCKKCTVCIIQPLTPLDPSHGYYQEPMNEC